MRLVSAKVGPFKSITEPQLVMVDESVSVLVGMNEAGKTVFLQALQKSNDAFDLAKFDPVEDYPRKDLPAYLREHKTKPAGVTTLTYELAEHETAKLNEALQTQLPSKFRFSVTHLYDNKMTIGISVKEQSVINSLSVTASLSTDATEALKKCPSLRDIPEVLNSISLTAEDKAFLATIESRIAKTKWQSVVQWEVWEELKSLLPKFCYFGEYELLPSKINLADLALRVEQAESKPKQLHAEHRAVLALLRMADIAIADFTSPGGYEPLKAKIEGVSISLTDQIMEFWKQNEDLEVEVDIKTDLEDEAPYNNGPNLYLRIKNRRHRGVSTPFRQRSRGFIWFFSFLVWFDNVQHQVDAAGKRIERDLILLLDEPGLSLHALAQADFLRYIDNLSEKHQVLYTTHSPFMIHSHRLDQVRVVEDRERVGTVISENVMASDPRTIFPLQAALGWTIAQNLFISEKNLLVEGTSDMIFLDAMSTIVESKGEEGLSHEVTIVPTGGLDKVATFIALLGANGLQLVVLHDHRGVSEQKLLDLVKQKIIPQRVLLNASQFRDLSQVGVNGRASDIEDLFDEKLYVSCFNGAFAEQLSGTTIKENELPHGDRIVERIERYLEVNHIRLRPSGGFNHHTVAAYFASHPPVSTDDETTKRFAALFKAVNALFASLGDPRGLSGKRGANHALAKNRTSVQEKIEPIISEAVRGLVKEEVHE